jgi:hypothetical protein
MTDLTHKTVRELLTPIMRQADATGHYLPSPATGGLRVVVDAAIARDERLTDIERKWDHLHQPGEITQEFADAVNHLRGVDLTGDGDGAEWLLTIGWDASQSEICVATISNVLLHLHACGISVEWPREESP